MDWVKEFERKLVSPEEAVKVVKSGDRVAIGGSGTEPRSLASALAAQRSQLRNVHLLLGAPTRDYGWFQEGWEESFDISVGMVTPISEKVVWDKRCDIEVGFLVPYMRREEEKDLKDIDIFLTEVGYPNKNGFCSCGSAQLYKKEYVRRARVVIAEVNERFIRTFGDNYIHVSEINYFVPHVSSGRIPGMKGARGAGTEPIEHVRPIAEYVSGLIKNGDCIQIGVGSVSEVLPRAGLFEGKLDLGWHSEATPRGIAQFVRQGIVTGKYKNIHTGKVVCSSVGGGDLEDLEFINDNPMFELYGIGYVDDPRVIAAHDNVVAIDQALAVDLTGMIAAESVGPRVVGAAGGQLAFAIGAGLSKGGRFITVLPSTAKNGTVSRIVPTLEPGTIVTVPRTLADIVVTEYGIARLRGKSQRQRAKELINIAHPDFREDLRKASHKLFGF